MIVRCNANNRIIFDLQINSGGRVTETDSIYQSELEKMTLGEAMTWLKTIHPTIKFSPRNTQYPY